MFRMSEVYYIAAEAIYKKDLDKAKDYLKLVKKGRGVEDDLEQDFHYWFAVSVYLYSAL